MVNLFVDCVIVNKFLFIFVGVDFFGLFIVKRGWFEVKRYGCIFICMIIRVVYIEVIYLFDIDFFV